MRDGECERERVRTNEEDEESQEGEPAAFDMRE